MQAIPKFDDLHLFTGFCAPFRLYGTAKNVVRRGRTHPSRSQAATARIFDKATFDLARMSQPGAPLHRIQETNVGKVGGGIPVTLNGSIVGAVGASAGTVEQDVAVADAAIAALGPEISEVRRQHREGIPT